MCRALVYWQAPCDRLYVSDGCWRNPTGGCGAENAGELLSWPWSQKGARRAPIMSHRLWGACCEQGQCRNSVVHSMVALIALVAKLSTQYSEPCSGKCSICVAGVL